jgi:hypothetical protein
MGLRHILPKPRSVAQSNQAVREKRKVRMKGSSLLVHETALTDSLLHEHSTFDGGSSPRISALLAPLVRTINRRCDVRSQMARFRPIPTRSSVPACSSQRRRKSPPRRHIQHKSAPYRYEGNYHADVLQVKITPSASYHLRQMHPLIHTNANSNLPASLIHESMSTKDLTMG